MKLTSRFRVYSRQFPSVRRIRDLCITRAAIAAVYIVTQYLNYLPPHTRVFASRNVGDGHASELPRACEPSLARSQRTDGTIDRPINWSQACDIFSFSITTDELLRRIISTYATNISKTKRPRQRGAENESDWRDGSPETHRKLVTHHVYLA